MNGRTSGWFGERDHGRRLPRLRVWVYDVCESILFAQMADVIAETPASQRSDWLSALEQHLRVDAVAGADFYVPVDKWCDGHEKEFLAILAQAARRLAERGRITAEDATRWTVLDNHPIIWRGQEFEDTGPAVAFAEALAEIIHGEYPKPPPGHGWFFGHPEVSTIRCQPFDP